LAPHQKNQRSATEEHSATQERFELAGMVTVFNDADVSNDDVGDGELRHLSVANDADCMLSVNVLLQSTKLPLFTPVVECCHHYDDDHCHNDSQRLDPVPTVRRIRFRYSFTCGAVITIYSVARKK